MKISLRLDYARFTEALVERQLLAADVAQHLLHQSLNTGALLPELLVKEGFVSDWEIARVSCELHGLAFLNLENYAPADGAREGLDHTYLHHYGLVPLDRYGKVLTVAIPGIVPTEVLEGIPGTEDLEVLAIVSTVGSNRAWLAEHLPAPALPASTDQGVDQVADTQDGGGLRLQGEDQGSWSDIFDAGDQAVQDRIELGDPPLPE